MKKENVIKGYESRRLQISTSFVKKMTVSALLFGGCMNAQALVITAENETACPKDAVILNSSQSSASSVTWQKKVGESWVDAIQLKVGVPFIYEMDDHDVEFRAVEKSETTIVELSNAVKITRGSGCGPEIHYSSTGDLIMGTDFNPTGENSGRLEQDVEHSFDDYSLVFSSAACSYTIGDLKSSFGNYIPSIDDSLKRDLGDEHENYFMNLTNPNGTVAEIKIPAMPIDGNDYRGQHYRFVMRAYLTPTCRIEDNMSFAGRTGQGMVTDDQMDVELYDDVTGTLLGSVYDWRSANVNRITFRDLMDVHDIPMSGGEYHTMRFEVTYYGYLPKTNNGLIYYSFLPEFTQMNCMNVSIDYISMEMENVSLSSKDAVEGEYVYATATGFPKETLYKWYKKAGEDWIDLFEISGRGDEYRTANLQVDYGKTEYKVEVDKGDGSLVTKEFTVVGAAPKDTILPGDTTGVIMIESPNEEPIVDVCTIEGFVLKTNVKLSEALVDLKRGVYIIGGKKYYISK